MDLDTSLCEIGFLQIRLLPFSVGAVATDDVQLIRLGLHTSVSLVVTVVDFNVDCP